MTTDFTLVAEKRDAEGKGASRRLRRVEGKVPAIIYGGQAEPAAISVMHKDLAHALENEAFYSHILTLKLDGADESVILKDLQRHPYKPVILHADFQRVSKDQKLHVHVPLHFTNEDKCAGVRQGGGLISHQLSEVEVVCLPANLPEFLEVDMTDVAIDQIVHLSDLKLPKGVELAELNKGADHDLPVVAVHKAKGSKSDESEEESEGGEE
ncbi:50S ribosomal protein L25/general stress protein Ctc [Hahella sp. CCB-MM4]|uniref:50S ribosomal protein L25/general stress protein Ctc n=1 Tax=Hahella sp. (strain CCB-MM4) TaxID=1926491 RepID=UPI000B9ADC00|nr:50S ribosomal protein L25/general stress protein Ctc [Hahella sp. CCB-MM4]OZG70682.1 50S ribosomal protein L25/general stress protein Ctc [Hahella sp. CCB-MM4]